MKEHFATRSESKDPAELELPGYLRRSQGWPIEPKAGYEKFSAYYNMDNGGGRFRSIYTEGNVPIKPIFSKWFSPNSDLRTSTISNKSTNYTDHEAFDDVGLPGFQFLQDPLDYHSRLHHTHIDSFDHVIEDDLKQASVIMAAFLYNTATRDERLPMKPSNRLEKKAKLKAEKARRLRERDANKALDIKRYEN